LNFNYNEFVKFFDSFNLTTKKAKAGDTVLKLKDIYMPIYSQELERQGFNVQYILNPNYITF